MTYEETLEYMYRQLPMYQRQGKSAFKKDLTNIKALLSEIDNPHKSFPSIHIAGTNGKGTVSHMIAAILQEHGWKVGLYTSPHYMDFRERIKVNGTWAPEDFVTSWIKDHEELIERVMPSFFEITVAMAFDYFKKKEVDIAVIETGLGGRLDSTNVVTPKLSVITHISLDHQNMLGDTIYQIAGEKAGIIKKDTPAVIGRFQESCDHVFIKKAKEMNSPISWASVDIDSKRSESTSLFISQRATYQIPNHKYESPFLDENRRTAIRAIEVFDKDEQIKTSTIELGLSNFTQLTKYIGRWQIISDAPLCITDSAHNEDAFNKVMKKLQKIERQKLHMVIGMVADKDVDKLLRSLPEEAEYYFTKAKIPRALDSTLLAEQATKYGYSGCTYDDVISAYQAAAQSASKNDLIYVGGSSFVVGDLLAELR